MKAAVNQNAFTLVEMIVVVSIGGILLGILLIGVGAVRTSARQVDTLERFKAIEIGLLAYRREFGQGYPPSNPGAWYTSDPSTPSEPSSIGPSEGSSMDGMDPPPPPEGQQDYPDDGHGIFPESKKFVSGTHLLTWSLLGADYLGTAGFEDLNGNGDWWDDLAELYALSADRKPQHRRYGPYVEPRDRNLFKHQSFYAQEFVLSDGFGFPILYYAANPGALRMVSTVDDPSGGVYIQADNNPYTGDGADIPGIDLGAGSEHRLRQHAQSGEVVVDSNPAVTDLSKPNYEGTFARFIWDRRVTVRNEPVNKAAYLLISPGPDALWGTQDDVTNFGL